jgi:large subunit ribosomal protein L23
MAEVNVNFKDAHDILLGPVVSEKSFELADQGKYTFKVAKDANKTEIKNAIQSIFDVKVVKVNTLNRKGKVKRTRFGFGKRADTKRAIVSVAPGQVINVFGTEQVK